jgi:hypothetical protein
MAARDIVFIVVLPSSATRQSGAVGANAGYRRAQSDVSSGCLRFFSAIAGLMALECSDTYLGSRKTLFSVQ